MTKHEKRLGYVDKNRIVHRNASFILEMAGEKIHGYETMDVERVVLNEKGSVISGYCSFE